MAKAKKKEYLIEDTIVIDNIYPLVESNLNTRVSSLKKCIERFINSRQAALYDYAPVDRIYFKKSDVNDFFKSINVDLKTVTNILPNLYYWKEDELQACKDEFSLTALMALRYLLREKKDNNIIELTAIYIAFSGKFYASCHYQQWPHYTPKREVMDYVINYMLSQKYDLVKEKSVFGAIRNLVLTWLGRYKDELASNITDERLCYIIHQLHNRIQASLRNIANLYYKAYDKKLYLNKESDNYDKDDYRIANNNSTVISNITERTMNYFVSTQISINVCYSVSGSGVDPYDVKAIFENILNSNEALDDLRTVINTLLTDFCSKYPEEKDLTGTNFIANSITMKPNTKDKNIIEMKNIILGWLNTSDRYKHIKTQATKNNYYKAILSYIAITVNIANKQS